LHQSRCSCRPVPELLQQSIHRTVEGGKQMSTAVLRSTLAFNGHKTPAERTTETTRLIPREMDVSRLSGTGYSNKTSAESLSISHHNKACPKYHRKLQERNRTHAYIIGSQADRGQILLTVNLLSLRPSNPG